MGMHVFSYLKQTLKRKDKSRDNDWDFGARQSSPVDATASTSSSRRDSRTATSASTSANASANAGAGASGTSSGSARRRRSASLDDSRPPYSPLVNQHPQQEEQQQQQQQQQQQRRVSAAVPSIPSGPGTDVSGPRSLHLAHAHAQTHPDSRGTAVGPRSGSPEDDVLLAAGESAKEVRSSSGKQSDKRRRALSMAPVAGPSRRPSLRHATSALTTRDSVPVPSSPTSSRSAAGSPTPSIQSFHSLQAGPSDASRRAALLNGKRSMPQLHNVWENFLEEAAEDVNSFSFPLPPQTPSKFATVHANSRTSTIENTQQPRLLHHTPTSSSSSASTATTTASVGTVRTLPRNTAPVSLPHSPSPKRSRGHLRASHQTSSSTSSATTSTHGSTSSMAGFSSASSMTTAPDDCDDGSHASDDPVPHTPRSTAPTSPRSFKFSSADHSSPPPIAQRLRKSPTSPALQYQSLQRGVSPTSSNSSDSCVSSLASPSHSQSTTPTPSSTCPTPSPTPCSPVPPSSNAKFIGRISPANSRISGQYRRTPEIELPEQPLSPGSTKGQKSLSNSYRYSSSAGRSQVELRLYPAHEEDGEEAIDEDVLSELGYYSSSSLRGKIQRQRQSIQSSTLSTSYTASSSPAPSGTPVVPPLRRSSRQHLRTVVTHSVDSLPLLRAKSASNIRHEELQRPVDGSRSAPPLPAAKENGTPAAASSAAPVYLHEARVSPRPPTHARSQTLQHMMTDASSIASSTTSSSRPGQGRLRSGSTSLVFNHTLPQAKVPPARPPPAPPLDMNSTARLQPPTAVGGGSAAASPLTPASAVHWGYAL